MLDDSVIDDLLAKLEVFTTEAHEIGQSLYINMERMSDLSCDIEQLQCELEDHHLKTQQADAPAQTKDHEPFESSMIAALRNAKIISGQMHGQPKICISEEGEND